MKKLLIILIVASACNATKSKKNDTINNSRIEYVFKSGAMYLGDSLTYELKIKQAGLIIDTINNTVTTYNTAAVSGYSYPDKLVESSIVKSTDNYKTLIYNVERTERGDVLVKGLITVYPHEKTITIKWEGYTQHAKYHY